MSRSLLRQLEQIKQSSNYDDQVAGIHTAAVAEPLVTGSGSLEYDLNNLRTLYRLAKGTTNWYDDLGNYFDPKTTNSGSDELREFNFWNIKGKSLDAQSIIVPIVSDNSGAGYSVASGTAGFIAPITTAYATWANRHGLPIFASVSGSGGGDNDYFDIGGAYAVCAVDILSVANNASIVDGSGNVIYALFKDGADYPSETYLEAGVGDGTNVYVAFYAGAAPATFPPGYETTTTVTSGGYVPPSGDDVNFDFGGAYVTPSGNQVNFDFNEYATHGGIKIIYPHRKLMSSFGDGQTSSYGIQEYEWCRTDFITKVEGDPILAEDISNLWAFVGTTDGDYDASGWTNTGANWPLASDPNNLWTAVDLLNNMWGDATYVGGTYITTGESRAESLLALDIGMKATEDAATAGLQDKYVEDVAVTIAASTFHATPADFTPEEDGVNMDVYVNGQLIAASTGAYGVGADRDYNETSTSGITFLFRVEAPATVTYVIAE